MQKVLINGVQCLFTPVRRHQEPECKTNREYPYIYDVRHDDDGEPCTIERSIMVNHFGTIIASKSFLKSGSRKVNGHKYAMIDTCECGCGSPAFLFME